MDADGGGKEKGGRERERYDRERGNNNAASRTTRVDLGGLLLHVYM